MCMRSKVLSVLLSVLFMAIPAAMVRADDADLFNWDQLPPLPIAVEGAFSGVSGEVLIVAGGSCLNYENDALSHQFSGNVYLLQPDAKEWTHVGTLNTPSAFGSSVTIDSGLVCIGGLSDHGESSDVILLRWDSSTQSLQTQELIGLPESLAMSSATSTANTIYVAGARTTDISDSVSQKVFWSIEVSSLVGNEETTWAQHPPCPGEGRFCPMVVAQSGNVYVFGGSQNAIIAHQVRTAIPVTEAYCFHPSAPEDDAWSPVADLPVAVSYTHLTLPTICSV